MKRLQLILGAAALLAALAPAAIDEQWKTPWSYEGPKGPDHWSELDPAYAACNAGKEQSPVDIQSAVKAPLPVIHFDYSSGPLKYLINNGYTIRVNYHDAPGAGNFITVAGKRYHLTQFHFHRPSEETVNGKPYAMVLHLMHEAGDGSVVGVAVFLKSGHANSEVQKIWDHMPLTKGGEQEIPAVEMDPAAMLPRDTGYYLYKGSITAPPCTENVTWLVLKTPIEVSAAQIDAFSRLYPHDIRPVQPLNGRLIQESE